MDTWKNPRGRLEAKGEKGRECWGKRHTTVIEQQ